MAWVSNNRNRMYKNKTNDETLANVRWHISSKWPLGRTPSDWGDLHFHFEKVLGHFFCGEDKQ